MPSLFHVKFVHPHVSSSILVRSLDMQHPTRLVLALCATLICASCGGGKSSYAPHRSGGRQATSTPELAGADSGGLEQEYEDADEDEMLVATGEALQPPPPTSSSARVQTESYAPIHENRFRDSGQQAFSTFSIDVDTAAYSNTRRFLRSGHMPPAGSVRIEEFVNYFSYAYPGPTSNVPFSVNSDVTIAPWNPKHQLVRIGLQGERMDISELPNRNLVFLVDVSGSMSSHDKLPLLREGFRMLTQTLGEEDYVSIVVYAGAAGAVLLPTSGADQESIMAALDTLQSGGSTNGGAGIQLAYKLAEQNFDPKAINRVILASDGDFNVGMTNKQDLIQLIERKRKSGVYLSVLGFGRGNLKDSTMEQIADKGNGNYSYIDSAAEARKVLVDEGGSTLITIAKDVKIQVEFNPDAVESYRLIGYENRKLAKKDFENDNVDAGELGPGHSVTALYEVTPKAGSRAQSLATVRLRYKRPNASESKLLTANITNRSTTFALASQDMRFAISVAGFGLLLRDSKHRGSLTWHALGAMAEDAVGNHKSRYRQEFLELIGLARKIAGPKAQLAK